MSEIKIDNGYLVIKADESETYVDGCDIAFDTEKAAEDAMDQLAEALCGKWLDGDPERAAFIEQ